MTLEIWSYMDDGSGSDSQHGNDMDAPGSGGGGGGGGRDRDYSGDYSNWYSDPNFDWGTLPDNYADPDPDPFAGTGANGRDNDTINNGVTDPSNPGNTTPESWDDIDPTDPDEVAKYFWQQTGPYTERMFSGEYAANMPNYYNYMQNTGMGTLQNYMSGNVNSLTSYFTDFMENNPAWEQNARYGESQLLERLGQYGGSASAGFSGQQSAGLGRYWSDQVADRWSQAAPAAMAQWGSDYSAGLSDYSNIYGQHTMDFGNALAGYNRPYDYAAQLYGGNQQQQGAGQEGEGSDFWSGVGTVAGMGIGAYFGGPIGASLGGGAGSIVGSWFD